MTNRARLLTAAVTAVVLSTPCIQAAEPAPNDTSAEIRTLRARLDQLEAQQQRANRERQEAERKLDERQTADKLSDQATRHDQFLDTEGFTAGYSDDKFLIQSGDKNFMLHPWAHFQFRGVALEREGMQRSVNGPPTDQWDVGFEIPRMRFGVDGNLFGPDLTYFFNWNTYSSSNSTPVTGAAGTVSNNQGGTMVLQEAWVKYHLPASDFSVQVGQLRDPVLHDQIVDARYQQSAERSLTADLFANGDGLTEGVMVIYDPKGDIHAEAGINHGMRSANTNFLSFQDNGAFNAFDYGVAGRAEYKLMGRWKDYNQVGGVGIKESLLVVGVGVDYSERGHSGQLVAAADVMYVDPAGLNFYGALVDRNTSHNFGIYTQSATGAAITAPGTFVANKSTNEYSILLQAGYLIDRFEPFARYEFIHVQGDANKTRNWIQCITGGANYYFYGNRLKVTGEVVWLPEGLPVNDSNTDLLMTPSGKGELAFMAQLQLSL